MITGKEHAEGACLMKKNLLFILLGLLVLGLAACGRTAERNPSEESFSVSTPVMTPGPDTEPVQKPAAESTPEPSPEPVQDVETEIRLRDDLLPEEYVLLDYAACTNSTLDAQTYIDTGISPTNNTRFYLDFECPGGYTVKDTWFFGCFDRDNHMYMEVGYHMGQGNPAHFYTATGIRYSQTEDSALRTIAWLRPGNYQYPDVVNGRTLYAFEEPCEQHLFLFSRQHMDREIAGTHDIVGEYDLRIYACRIWQEDEPVRDYLPCLRLSDGRVGMYDLVEGRAYFSDGTEELTAGEKLLPERSVDALNGEIGESVTPPELQGFLFQCYFTGPNGTGEQILDEDGRQVAKAGTEEDLVLYAFWIRDEAYFEEY